MRSTKMRQNTKKKIQDPEIKGANIGENAQNEGGDSPRRAAVSRPGKQAIHNTAGQGLLEECLIET